MIFQPEISCHDVRRLDIMESILLEYIDISVLDSNLQLDVRARIATKKLVII